MRVVALACALLLVLASAVEGAVTYVKPHWQPVSEWSPASDRAAAASAHSAAMKKYSDLLEANPRMKPCVYC